MTGMLDMVETKCTLRILKEYLNSLDDEQLDKVLQVANPHREENGDIEPIALMPILAIGTVKEMGFNKCRSSEDNKYHEEDIVFLVDENPFSIDGIIGYVLNETEGEDDVPVFYNDIPTNPIDQEKKL